jgi:quinol monooxygenase YgiN
MFVVTVEFHIAHAFSGRFRERVLQQAKDSLERETDCHCFDVCENPEVAGRFFLYEIYGTPGDFQIHLKSDHFLAFNDEVADWIESKSINTYIKLPPQDQ